MISQVITKILLDFPSWCSWGHLPSANVVWPQGVAKQIEATTFSMLETPTSEHILGKFIFSTSVQPEKKQPVLPRAGPSGHLGEKVAFFAEQAPSVWSREWAAPNPCV